MTIGSRHDYIKYRLNRADDAFDEALILAENKRWNAVINRLYYACFYSVIALLLENQIETDSHDGARNQFGLHFVKTGKIEKNFGKLFSKLFDYRQKGDYGDLFDFDAEIAEPLIPQVEQFILEIKKQF